MIFHLIYDHDSNIHTCRMKWRVEAIIKMTLVNSIYFTFLFKKILLLKLQMYPSLPLSTSTYTSPSGPNHIVVYVYDLAYMFFGYSLHLLSFSIFKVSGDWKRGATLFLDPFTKNISVLDIWGRPRKHNVNLKICQKSFFSGYEFNHSLNKYLLSAY